MAKATTKKAAKKTGGAKKRKAAPKGKATAQAKKATSAAGPTKKEKRVTNSMDTWIAKPETTERGWWIVDAAGQRVGRVASVVANLIRGKHKPTFTPHTDVGDFVIVINTDKVELSGNKAQVKNYYRHSRFFGSLKAKTAAQYMIEDSTFVLKQAVEGMLPDNKMAYSLINKLKTYKGAEHPHATQKPQVYQLARKG